MSVMILTVMLAIGFVVTGLVGFLGWRERMHEGAGSGGRRLPTPSTSTRSRADDARQSDLAGARA